MLLGKGGSTAIGLHEATPEFNIESTGSSRVRAFLKRGPEGEVMHDKSAVLAVSITGRPEDEERMKASIEMLGRTFQSGAIVLGDSLARHTIAVDTGCMKGSAERARQIGEEWERKYRPIMNQQSIPIRLIHWDHWLEKKAFPEKKSLILSLYHYDAVFRSSVDGFVADYIQRRNFHDNSEFSIKEMCLEYALEELAVMLLLAHEGWDYILYPSAFPEPLVMLIDRWVTPFFQHAMQSRSFRYRSSSRRA